MKWMIQQLKKHQTMTFEETIDLSDIRKLNNEIRKISPVMVSGKALVSGDTFTFPMMIKGVLTLPCSRTLEDVELPFEIEAKETFQLSGSYYSSEEEGSLDDIHTVEGDVIDLDPYIKELILLEIPLQIFSDKADSEALRSGKDWEFLTEEDKNNRIDPRLADLSKFFEKNNEK